MEISKNGIEYKAINDIVSPEIEWKPVTVTFFLWALELLQIRVTVL